MNGPETAILLLYVLYSPFYAKSTKVKTFTSNGLKNDKSGYSENS